MRGAKKPWMPKKIAEAAAIRFIIGRAASIAAGSTIGDCADTRSQNSRRRSTRRSGALPAISAALMAPIEMPTTQSGANPSAARPS